MKFNYECCLYRITAVCLSKGEPPGTNKTFFI